MEGYYNGTIFHRIVKGFIAQCGDPLGTGYGGESIYGKPFKDEFHQRLRFNRRGLVGMANSGPDDNRSQFFFTLDAAPELDKKHTLFGKIGGKTIYNMIRLIDIEIDGNDRPLEPPKIFSIEILHNPFEDIEPRKIKQEASKNLDKDEKKKARRKQEKNFKLLSFGEEAEEDDGELTAISKEIKIQSSHDVLNDPKLSTEQAVDVKSLPAVENIRQKLSKKPEAKRDAQDSLSEDEEELEKRKRKAALKKEARELKRELAAQQNKKIIQEEPKTAAVSEDEETSAVNELMTRLKHEKQQFVKMKKESSILRKGGNREKETLAMLSGFQTKLSSTEESSLREEAEEESDMGWMGHTLKFESAAARAKDANMRDEDTYDIFDPRNPINQRRREASGRKDAKRAKR
ncbi:spliceosome-associated protein CWC27 homolog isoform X2 [Rhopilema esculentum]